MENMRYIFPVPKHFTKYLEPLGKKKYMTELL